MRHASLAGVERPSTALEYDVIVIGSGMGGMACAAFLALEGRRVLVLERHFKPGGLTHEFERPGGFAWDVGLHYVGGMGVGQAGRALMDVLTDGALDWRPLEDPYDVFSYPGFRFEVPFGEARYRERLEARFAGERHAIARYFQDVHTAAQWLGLHMAQKAMPSWMAFFTGLAARRSESLALQTTKAYFEAHFQDPLLRAVLASQWGDYGLLPSESAFAQHATVVHSYFDGAYYPVGGAQGISQGFRAMLAAHGGELRAGQEVLEILVEDGSTRGVRVRSSVGTREELAEYRAPIVVSSAGAIPTYLKLLAPSVALPFRDDIASFRHGHSAITLYLGLRASPVSIGQNGANTWIFSDLDHEKQWERSGRALFGEPAHAFVAFPSAKDPKATRHTAEIVAFIDYEAFDAWRDSTWKQRPESYARAKEVITAGLLAFVEERMPGLSQLVEYRELSTPLTLEHFSAHPFGAFYGVPAVPERYRKPWLDITTPITGLYLTGEDIGSLGILGAGMSGALTAAKVLGARGLPAVMRALRPGAKRAP